MKKHDIVVFRIHDHMHAQRPDFTFVGFARAVGLDSRTKRRRTRIASSSRRRRSGRWRPTSSGRTGARALRVVGDPNAKVSRIQLGVGYATPPSTRRTSTSSSAANSRKPTARSTVPEYVLDAMTLGIAKGWIMLGHAVSEEAGMLEMAQWIKAFVPEVPVQLVKAEEPFWIPT